MAAAESTESEAAPAPAPVPVTERAAAETLSAVGSGVVPSASAMTAVSEEGEDEDRSGVCGSCSDSPVVLFEGLRESLT